MSRCAVFLRVVLFGAGAWLLAACEDPDAVTFVVDTVEDAPAADPGDGLCESTVGGCTLRAALQEANERPHTDTIVLADGATYALEVAGAGEDAGVTGDLDVHHSVRIVGDATIDAAGLDRVLDVHTGTLTLTSVTLTGGSALRGGAVRVGDDAGLTAIGGELRDNAATIGGGAIDAGAGFVNLVAVAILENSGGHAGAIAAEGPVRIQHSTIAANSATSGAGALNTAQTAELRWTTIALNGGTAAGVVGPVDLTASVVADNAVADCEQLASSGGYNADSDGSCLDGTGTGDLPDTDPEFTALGTYGGPTRVLPPSPASPLVAAIPVGDVDCGTGAGSIDQHVTARPKGPACDIGAREPLLPPIELTVTHGGDDVADEPESGVCQDAGGAPGSCSLRAAIDVVNANPDVESATVTIDPGVDLITLSIPRISGTLNETGDLVVVQSVAIEGNGATVDADGIDRVLRVLEGTTSVSSLVLTGGSPATNGGGLAVGSGASVVLDHVAVVGNQTNSVGGGIRNDGTLTVTNSSIANNVSGGSAGGVSNAGGTLTVTNSTISGNISRGRGGGIRHSGSGSMSVTFSTITNNRGMDRANGIDFASTTTSSATVAASVVDNATPNCATTDIFSGGYNVVSDTSCGFTAPGDVEDVVSLLEPLGGSGGPTPGHLPHGDSEAVERVPVGTSGLCDGSVPTDQQGAARPAGVACNAGSMEGATGVPAPPPLALTVTHGGDAAAADPESGVCQDDGGTPGACSLRAAIDVANASLLGPTTVAVDPGVDVVGLTRVGSNENFNDTGDLDIWRDLTIVGNEATLHANQLDRAVNVRSGVVAIEDLTITGGEINFSGGGLLNSEDAITRLERVNIVGNVTRLFNSHGGGAFNQGELTVVDSAVLDNTTTGTTTHGGGIDNRATLTVVNSTIAGNAARNQGGGIRQAEAGSTATIVASTITNNRSGTGGHGIHRSTGSVTVSGSVIDNLGPDCNSTLVASDGYNVVSDGSCGLAAAGDVEGVSSLLGPLGDNGGSTLTHLPFADSPAVDRIPLGTPGLCDATTAADQRGVARPQGAACDAGSVEGTSGTPAPPTFELIVTHGNDAPALDPMSGVCLDVTGGCSLRAAVQVANTNLLADAQITVDPTVATLLLTREGAGESFADTGDLDVWRNLTIAGNGATLNATGIDRALHAHTASLAVEDLVITGGVSGAHGGAIRVESAAVVDLVSVAIVGNATSGAHGGGIHNEGVLTVARSTLADNAANGSNRHGGAIHNVGGQLAIVNSTLSANSGTGSGGGIYGTGASSSMSITASTIVANTSVAGGSAVHVQGGSAWAGAAILGGAGGPTCNVAIASGGYNVASDESCGLLAVGDQQLIDPLLGPLADNGGSTPTHLPDGGSPAVDTIPIGVEGLCDGSLPTDQRGELRPVGAGCDAGAVERQPEVL